MGKKETGVKYNMLVRDQRPGESDYQYFRSLAKMADQRLVRLERYANQPGYENILKYAYDNAMYDIKQLSKNAEATRFNMVPAKNKDGGFNQVNLHARINAVKRFLESPTSTKQGIQKVYKERAKTTNKKYGTNFTWQELANFYKKSQAENADNKYGSKTIVRALGAMKRIGDDPEKIKAALEGNIKISDDGVVDTVARALLEDGFTFSDLTDGEF